MLRVDYGENKHDWNRPVNSRIFSEYVWKKCVIEVELKEICNFDSEENQKLKENVKNAKVRGTVWKGIDVNTMDQG